MGSREQRARLRQAERASGLWLDLEEVARSVCSEFREQCRGPLVYFTKRQWTDFFYRGKRRPSEAAQSKGFERWKQRVRRLQPEVLFPGDSGVAFDLGVKTGSLYAIDQRVVRDHAAAAAERAVKLRRAFESAKPPSKRRRTATVAEVARQIGVSKPVIHSWVRRHGLPHTKKKGRTFLDVTEVEEWAAERERRGVRVATARDVRERIPAEVARPRLKEIRDYLGLTNARLSELLGVSKNTVDTWLAERRERSGRSIPASAMEKAEQLMETQLALTVRRTAAQRISPSQLRSALKEARGVRGAARILEVSQESVRKLAQDYGIEARPARVPVETARPRLLEIRDQLNLSNKRFAELLETKAVTLKTWLGTGGKWRKIRTIPWAVLERAEALLKELRPSPFTMTRLQRITRDQVEEAWEASGHKLTKAAKALGVPPGTFRKLAEAHGVELGPLRLIDRITKRDLQALMEKHGGVKARVARELGVTGPYVGMLLKRAGLSGSTGKKPRKGENDPMISQRNREEVEALVDSDRPIWVVARDLTTLGYRLGLVRGWPNTRYRVYAKAPNGLWQHVADLEEESHGRRARVVSNPPWAKYLSKVISWTATGAVADLVMSRFDPYLEKIETGAQEAIVGGVSKVGRAAGTVFRTKRNPIYENLPPPPWKGGPFWEGGVALSPENALYEDLMDYVHAWVERLRFAMPEERVRAGSALQARGVHLFPWWGDMAQRAKHPELNELMVGWFEAGDPEALRWEVRRFTPGVRAGGPKPLPYEDLGEAVGVFLSRVGPEAAEAALWEAQENPPGGWANPWLDHELFGHASPQSNPCPLCVGAAVLGVASAARLTKDR